MKPDLKALLEMSSALRAAERFDETLRAITKGACDATRSSQAFVHVLDEDEPDDVWGPWHVHGEEGLVGWCARHGEPACVNDVETDPRCEISDGSLGTRSGMLVVPLRLGGGKVIGVLVATRDDGSPCLATDVSALEMIAALAAPYIEIERLRALAETDTLTGLCNRRTLATRFRAERDAALRHGRPLSVVMLDLDEFGNINTRYGHVAGDEVLVEVARRMRRACRSSDILYRWGGDEFLVLLPETDVYEANIVAARVLAEMRATSFSIRQGDLRVRASAGACAVEVPDTLFSVQARASERLRKAKRRGRDQVVGDLAPLLPRIPLLLAVNPRVATA